MYLEKGWRERLWDDIDQAWDLIVIGGGITGAGVVREATRAGLRVLLLERDDFAGGTSACSSKLVHGGLRYLAAGQWGLTRESVRERQALMAAAPGLVTPLDFLLPMYQHSKPGRFVMGAALRVYDLMARRSYARYLQRPVAKWRLPYLRQEGLNGAFLYPDAGTDDARLVLRVVGEAVADGAQVLNYCGVTQLIHADNQVVGVSIHDRVLDQTTQLRAAAIVNATGPWADALRSQVLGRPRIRPLRGSHFVFDYARLPVAQAVTLFHPVDKRPLFAFPWQGVTVFGTTDLDHDNWPAMPARMTDAEAEYLIAGLNHYFGTLGLRREDALCSYSGVRPVVAHGSEDPSAESRERAIWLEQGLLTVTGGKLTTYRVTALEVLQQLASRFPAMRALDWDAPILDTAGGGRLAGRHGACLGLLQARMPADEFVPVAGSIYLWAELRWALRYEAVVTLVDLLLRRTRLGLLLPQGGAGILDSVGRLCREELGWSEAHWTRERDAYRKHWDTAHAVPLRQQAEIT